MEKGFLMPSSAETPSYIRILEFEYYSTSLSLCPSLLLLAWLPYLRDHNLINMHVACTSEPYEIFTSVLQRSFILWLPCDIK